MFDVILFYELLSFLFFFYLFCFVSGLSLYGNICFDFKAFLGGVGITAVKQMYTYICILQTETQLNLQCNVQHEK